MRGAVTGVAPPSTPARICQQKRREPKPPLSDQPGFQYAVFRLEPLADAGGFFDAGRIVVERDRNHGIRIEASLLFFRHLRSHEGSRLATMLVKPERPPERLAEDEGFCRIAPIEAIEERLSEPLPEEPFRIGVRDRRSEERRVGKEGRCRW